MAPSSKDTSERSYDSAGKARQGHYDAGKTRGVDATGDARNPPGGGSAKTAKHQKPPSQTTPTRRPH
ncbi:MAG TPA: hypothetical protein VEL28_18300 [Candidatus Binatia bacterium]|nr:hypothetical protein [Candidatus Binatia bacterium]